MLPPQRRDWTSFHARLHQRLRRSPWLLPAQGSILMAVSGGQDSVAMARLLLDLQPKWHWRLAIAHGNHRWHPREDQAAAQVQQLAAQWQLPFWLFTAASPPQGEGAARAWRYGQLGQIAQAEGFEIVVTGHTASDRAETLLYNLARGSGLDGLAALGWKRPLVAADPTIQLVRPLLALTRAETGEICDRLALPLWQDPINQDLSYRRNRLRHQVLPLLTSHINPRSIEHLAQTAELLEADLSYLEAQAQQLHQRVESQDRLNRLQLRQAPLALQRRVVRQFLRQRLPMPPNAAQIEKVVALIAAPRGAQTDPLAGGAIAQVEGDWIRLV